MITILLQTRVLVIGALISVANFYCSCTQAQNPGSNETTAPNDSTTLIVYLSRTKNTAAVAQIIHQKLGGKVVALELQNPYPQNYQQIVDQVAKENQSGFLPPLKTKIDNLEKYKTIFLGFPTWGMQLPPPIKSFLKEYNLKGKTIVPFNTNAGYGVGSGFETIKKMATGARVLEGISLKGGVERDGILFVMKDDKFVQATNDVAAWLKKLKLIP